MQEIINKGAWCRTCGRKIVFIKTMRDRTIAVNAEPVEFVPDVNGNRMYVLPDGMVLHGVAAAPGDPDIHKGYIAHAHHDRG